MEEQNVAAAGPQSATSATSKQTKIDAILLLRYHTLEPRQMTAVYASYAEIARLCKVPSSTVRSHCIRAVKK